MYDVTTGAELLKFNSPEPAPGDFFGGGVQLSGNTLVVFGRGGPYLFDVSDPVNPVLRSKFVVPPDIVAASCPCGLALSGNLILVGGRFDRPDFSSGAAWLFDATTGERLSKITVSSDDDNSGFGDTLALSGTTAVIGASFADGPRPFTSFGAAYVFDVSDPRHPVQVAKLTASDGEGQGAAWFGLTVAMSGTRILIGAPQEFNAGGEAYLYRGPAVP